MLRSIYFLIVRFPPVADFAKAVDLRGCMYVVLNEITDPNNVSMYRARSKADQTQLHRIVPATDPPNEISPDYLMVKLLIDFLNS
ncbi:unnamed protein product [Echinostoma caproni]|uniref:Uncharacterized protein n=1 Tax=Echinostoma caproni TaxID=27848 RepID=A0A3P8HZZ2_9TREM|nr:unnamed protein product [Echinostoma caproni]